MKSAEREKDR